MMPPLELARRASGADAAGCAASPRTLLCLWGEMRGLRATVGSLQEHLVRPLGADVCGLFQAGLPDDQARLGLLRAAFGDRLVHLELYQRPAEPGPHLRIPPPPPESPSVGNWRKDSNLQQYINFERYADLLAALPAYDYYLFSRSDFCHAYGFPALPPRAPESFWIYDGHDHGGINYTLVVVPRRFVDAYLRSPADWIRTGRQGVTGPGADWNCERFMGAIFAANHWPLAYIEPNAYLTAEALGDRTTWAPVRLHPEYQVLYKYEEQVERVFRGLRLLGGRPAGWRLVPRRNPGPVLRLRRDTLWRRAWLRLVGLLGPAPACR